MTGFETYIQFMSLKQHFQSEKYDYFKYNGKMNLSPKSFDLHKDKFLYIKLSKQRSKEENRDFIVASMIKGKVWIRDFLEEEAEETYKDYKRRRDSLTYIFKNDLNTLFDQYDLVTKVFSSISGQYPRLLELYITGQISPESVSILEHFTKFSRKFDSVLGKDDVIWSKHRLIISKYYPFIEYKEELCKRILKDMMEETNK